MDGPASSLPDLPEPSGDQRSTHQLEELAGALRGQYERTGAIPGQRIGPYKLLSELGEGGFGEVWLAERREPFVQRVALKLIKPGMDSRAVLARFEQERQALAVMDHPNVAKVLDGGVTDSGRPYFVMEHVQGESITVFCDRNTYTVKQRLELFVQVCEAVQHAHHKGIIHRDIKPSNILVTLKDEKPIPKVIDFGVAKAISQTLTDKTIFTEQGRLIGTPEYMSPEQAEMGAVDVDTRTDVYSLGVVLYELLSGMLPFDPKSLRAAGYEAIRKIIREQDPPKPSTRLSTADDATAAGIARRRESELDALGRELRRELDWIPLKALRKDRVERYRTPSDLADDIRRYLKGEALEAGPEGAGYRLRKLLRRHRGQVIAGGLLAATLLVAAAVSTWFGVQARRRADDMQRVLDFEGEVIASTEWENQGALLTESVLSALDAALTKAGLSDDDAAAERREFEQTWRRIDATDAALNLLDRANMQPAVAKLDEKFQDSPLIAAELRHTLAQRYWLMGLFAPATVLEVRVVEDRRRLLGNEHRDTLRSIGFLGKLYRLQDKLDLAEPLYHEVLKTQRRVLGPMDVDTLESVNNLGVLMKQMNRLGEARDYYQAALAGRTRVLGPEHADTLITLSNLGVLLKALGELEEAESCHSRVLAIRRRTLGSTAFETINSMNNLASVLQARGKADEAGPLYQEALDSWRATLGSRHRSTLIAISNYAFFLQSRGDLDTADPLSKEAVETARDVLGAEHSLTLRFARNRAGLQMLQKRPADAAALLEEFEPAARRTYTGSAGAELAAFLTLLGSARARAERFAVAESCLLEAERLLDGATVSEKASCVRALAALYEAWHRAEPDAGHDVQASDWKKKLPPAAPPAGGKSKPEP